jgi:hypothetical protein
MLECHNLPFVKVNPKADIDNRVNWFAVQSTGHSALDCEVGKQCGYALVDFLRVRSEWDSSRFYLGAVVMSMLSRDDLTGDARGLLVGFFSALSGALMIPDE